MTSGDDREIELRILRLTNEGDGVGSLPDGPVVFVPYTAPGDRVRVRVVQKRKRFWRAECLEVLEAGPGRTEPRCAVFGSCGGCAWQHLSYEAQLEAKAEILTSALQRIGKLELPAPVEVLPSPSAYAYRGRARIRVQEGQLGYLQRGSHDFCAAESCPVLLPVLKNRWREMNAEGDARDGEWELASGRDSSGREEVVRAALFREMDGMDARIQPDASLDADPLFLEVEGRRIEISAGGFAQANPLLYDILAQQVNEAVGSGDRLLELYCGAGFFTVGLAQRFSAVQAVEQSQRAAYDLGKNLSRSAVVNVLFTPGRVEEVLQRPGIASFAPQVV
ncbi:MAG: class I SAM-dependent RNA methyltransferase, partial [Deltaproteobacteria bacterium]|nr:class I SAM-dependent RNA methyltransferase [Deltaproteobacteria bacterium]